MAYSTPLWRKCLPFAFPLVVAVVGGLNLAHSPEWRGVFQQRQRLEESLASFSGAKISSKQLCAGQPIELADEFIEAEP